MSHRNRQVTSRHRRLPVLIGLTAVGGLALASQGLPASAETVHSAAPRSAAVAAAPLPPDGESWIQGSLTDQANHPLNNVNVEVWTTDPNATTPAASNLTYAGAPADGRHQNGVYRVAVPAGTPYILTFSTVGGQEDGDAYRAQSYGEGRPIMTRSQGQLRGTPVMAKAGRVINLGKTQMVHQGTVNSKTTARLKGKTVTAGKRGQLNVRVSSPFVSNVTGKVTVKVKGRKTVSNRLTATEGGRSTVRLPKLPVGTHRAVVQFQGTGTVAPSKAQAVKVKVAKKKKK